MSWKWPRGPLADIDLKEQHMASVVLLLLNILLSGYLWSLGRYNGDIFVGALGFGFVILSIVTLLPVLLKKHDISFALMLLVVLYVGLIVFAIVGTAIVESTMYYLVDWIMIISLIPWFIFLVVAVFQYNMYTNIYLPVIQAEMTPRQRHLAKRRTKHGLLGIIIGLISIEMALALPPGGMVLGGIALLLGLNARRRRDKLGIGGILLGMGSILLGLGSIIFYFTYGRHFYLPL